MTTSEEYLKFFNEKVVTTPEKEVLIEILKRLLEDTQILVSKRKAVGNKQMAACFDQQDSVWRAFCKKLPEKRINQDAFVDSVRKGSPNIFYVIMSNGMFKEYMHRQEKIAQLSKVINKVKSL